MWRATPFDQRRRDTALLATVLSLLCSCGAPAKMGPAKAVEPAKHWVTVPMKEDATHEEFAANEQGLQGAASCPQYMTARRQVEQGSKSSEGLLLIDLATGEHHPISTNPSAASVSWAPDGTRVAFHSSADGVTVLELETGHTSVFKTATKDFQFSGDSRFLLYYKGKSLIALELETGIETLLSPDAVWLATHPSAPWVITQEDQCTYLVDITGEHTTRTIDQVGPRRATALFSSKGDQFVVGDHVGADQTIPMLRAGLTADRAPQEQCEELVHQCKPLDCVCGDEPCSRFHRSDSMNVQELLGWDDRYDAPLLVRAFLNAQQPGVWLRATKGFPEEFFPLIPAERGFWHTVGSVGPGTFVYSVMAEWGSTPNPKYVVSDGGRRFTRWLKDLWTYYFTIGAGSQLAAYTDLPGAGAGIGASIYVAPIGGSPRKVLSGTSHQQPTISYTKPSLQPCPVRQTVERPSAE